MTYPADNGGVFFGRRETLAGERREAGQRRSAHPPCPAGVSRTHWHYNSTVRPSRVVTGAGQRQGQLEQTLTRASDRKDGAGTLRPAVCDATVSDPAVSRSTVHQDGFGGDLRRRPQRSKMLHCSPFAGVTLRVEQDRTRRYGGLNPIDSCAPYDPVDCHALSLARPGSRSMIVK